MVRPGLESGTMSRRLILIHVCLAIAVLAVIGWRLRAAKARPDPGGRGVAAPEAAKETAPVETAIPAGHREADPERDLLGIIVARGGRPVAGARVRGRVTEARSGAPIAGARVRQDRFPRESTLTDADGRYSLSGVHRPRKQDPESTETECLSGEGGLVAEAKGFRPDHEYPDEDGITDFALEPAARVEGRVVDPGGNPVGGASVAAARDQVSPDDYRSTGADGRFTIDGMEAATVYLLLVNADGFGLVALEFDAPAEGESRDLGDIRLALACTVAGRVVSSTGEPVADVRVTLQGSPDDRGRPSTCF